MSLLKKKEKNKLKPQTWMTVYARKPNTEKNETFN